MSATIAAWLLEKSAEAALATGAKGLWGKITEKKARQALAHACAAALEAAIRDVPGLGEDLRSESFRTGVIQPVVRGLLEQPSDLVEADGLADRYIAMFVERYAGGDVDAALARIFQTDRASLHRAFAVFLQALKDALYASEHWREAQHYVTTERMAASLVRIETLLDERLSDQRAVAVDLGQARREARVASAAMCAWPSEIAGLRLETPVLARLVSRIRAEPAGRTLLVGEAGCGKSALLARLTGELEGAGVTVLAIKADLLPASLASIGDLAAALGMGDGLEDRLAAMAAAGPVALLIDQLDAVSDIMDRRSDRMGILLQLVHRLGSRERAGDPPPPIHVLISSRPFEAAHDARFAQLRAETMRLDLLHPDQVDSMLIHLGLLPGDVADAMRETLRRPFALRLFAEIVARGVGASDLSPSGLLDAWLASADLGAPPERKETTDFLLALASEMIETETLWRPADRFELAHAGAVQRAEAAGLIVRSEANIGFVHQSWLDDFQAKTFATAQDFADYCWARQDGLFIRASVLRTLERLRSRDERAYETALRILLGSDRTRRHILHLVADIVATARRPLACETGWIGHWIRSDLPLASRALRQVLPHWEGWRDVLRGELPEMMARSELHWQTCRLMAAEARIDAAFVTGLIDRHWNAPERDTLVFDILQLSGYVGPDVETRLRTIFARTAIEDHQVSSFIRTLSAEGRFDEAAAIVALWLEFQPTSRSEHPTIHELEALAQAAPQALSGRLMAWFVALAERDVEPAHDFANEYPRSQSLPHELEGTTMQGSPYAALLDTIRTLAVGDPEALRALFAPYLQSEVDQVQEVIATGLAAAGAALASHAFDYLVGDSRRLRISSVITSGGDGVIRSIDGWHSQELVRAIVPYLSEEQLAALRDAIEDYGFYTAAAMADETRAEEIAGRQDHYRFPLLAALPPALIAPDRAAALAAWQALHEPTARVERGDLCGWVGSPMTHEEMAEAGDAEILAMLDEFHDAAPRDAWSRPISRSGGATELSRAFGAFGKAYPARAIALAASLEPERHQRAAGELVRELGGLDDLDPAPVLALVRDLDARGFATREWRGDAASALQNLAARAKGLDDAVVDLLEGWLERDPARIAAQTGERLAYEARNPRDRGTRDRPRPLLFGSGDAMGVLPGDNFTILAALSNAFLCRPAPDYDGWIASLERQVEHPEDPGIWSAILKWRGQYLGPADAERVAALLARIHARFPEALRAVDLIPFLWRLRSRLSSEILIDVAIHWMTGNEEARQAAGELFTAAHLVAPDDPCYIVLSGRLDRTDPAIEIGVLFSASAAWRERDPVLRPAAHAVLMAALPGAQGAAAHAISRALSGRTELVPDAMTRALLEALPGEPAVLDAALLGRFLDGLQGLLLHPRFDEAVLGVIEAIATQIKGQRIYRTGLRGDEIVRVAVALQRSDGPVRSRAMDVYERLLDAAVYGAEEAARAALER